MAATGPETGGGTDKRRGDLNLETTVAKKVQGAAKRAGRAVNRIGTVPLPKFRPKPLPDTPVNRPPMQTRRNKGQF